MRVYKIGVVRCDTDIRGERILKGEALLVTGPENDPLGIGKEI